jgi:hypothetical protein
VPRVHPYLTRTVFPSASGQGSTGAAHAKLPIVVRTWEFPQPHQDSGTPDAPGQVRGPPGGKRQRQKERQSASAQSCVSHFTSHHCSPEYMASVWCGGGQQDTQLFRTARGEAGPPVLGTFAHPRHRHCLVTCLFSSPLPHWPGSFPTWSFVLRTTENGCGK